WLAADGDARSENDESLGKGIRCDPTGCVAPLGDGRVVALSIAAEAMIEDCEIAALVVTARNAPTACEAPVIDRNAVRAGGAMSGRWINDALLVEAARPESYRRPWTPARSANPPAPIRPVAPRDATPRATDLDADDVPSVAPE
ncbi:MAG: ComEC/Rec2 family competence protein, partial [Pseudorhodoplanes sp.]